MYRLIVAGVLLLAPCHSALAEVGDSADCAPAGEYGFICGLQNAEDLVQVPDTQWIIASSMAPAMPLYLIDATAKTWSGLYPGISGEARHDKERFADCPGPPDTSTWVTHGLNLQPGPGNHSTLYVVAHGGREAIEVFDLVAGGDRPELLWIGCLLTPEGLQANSVASRADGSLLITVPLLPGISINDGLGGKPTGGVYRWSPGDSTFSAVVGTEMPYANGIEFSPDGETFYVASSGNMNITAWSNTNPARLLGKSADLDFLPDNLHLAPDGTLLTAGLNLDDSVCGEVDRTGPFDFQAFMTCPRAFTVWSADPETLEGRVIATGPANPQFSNITMALPVGDELWIGTFHGDRVAYTAMSGTAAESGQVLALRPQLLAISVGDLDASRKWYSEVLGFAEQQSHDFPDQAMRLAFLQKDGFELELIEIANTPAFSPPDPDNPASRRGMVKFAFYTDGIDVLYSRVTAAGAVTQSSLRPSNRTGGRFFIVTDPDGNWIQVFGPAN